MTNYVNLALEFKDVTKIRALPPDRDESKIIKYMRFVINICNDGKNLTHTIQIIRLIEWTQRTFTKSRCAAQMQNFITM